MRRMLVALLALAVLTGAHAQTPAPAPAASATEPASPAAQQALDAWLAAFNSGDRAQLEALVKRYPHERNLDDTLQFRDEVGGFVLIRREPGDASTARALLREGNSETYVRMQVTLPAQGPAKFDLNAIPTPEDLRPARLAQQQAIAATVAHTDADAAKDLFAGAMLIGQGDQILLQKAWGYADRASKQPMTVDTRLRLGSMNKMITSVATLQLVQAGKLSLDGTVGDYLKQYPNADIRKVTVRQLLSHRGGTGDIFGPDFDRERLNLRTHADYVRLYGARGPIHPPGEKRSYSNYGFVLLGAIIEAVSGQSYYDYVDQHIYAKAGMRDSGSLPESEPVKNRARPYMRERGQWVDAKDTLPYRGMAAGGGYSTVGDLFRFARALQNGTLVDPALLAQANGGPGYGLGFASNDINGVRWYGHGGGAPGMNADFRVFPQLDRVVITLSNLDPPTAERQSSYYLARMPMPASAPAPAKP